MLKLLYADAQNRILEHPRLIMLGHSGNSWIIPEEEEIVPLPEGATLVSMPGYLPVGYDLKKNRPVTLKEEGVWAVAALLPQGFTRTYLPAGVKKSEARELPLFGYTAVGIYEGKMYAAAVATDEDKKWNPRYYNTPDLPQRVERMREQHGGNSIIEQLAHCSLQYGCFTAQNIFYRRWEGGIPTTPVCNARCLGCLSEAHSESISPQNRLCRVPSREEIVTLGAYHLNDEDAIISFGQGCEGEPSLNAHLIGEAIREIRSITAKGTININTNAGYTSGIEYLANAGLDSMRVTMFSCREEDYLRYHQPAYSFNAVGESIDRAAKAGVKVAINLLAFPGFTDTEEQYRALADYLKQHPVYMVQMRNLNLDPELLYLHFPPRSAGMGMVNMLSKLEDDFPHLVIGSYTHPIKRRG